MVIKSLNRVWLSVAMAASLALASVSVPAPAQAMTVQPVVIDLRTSGRQMTAVISVQNSFATPLPVELRAVEATFDENGLRPTEAATDDLLIFPPQALIPPGQTQSFRIQFVGDPSLARSKHYYVTVAQLPVQLPQGQSAIQILYNFQVVVSVGPAGARPNIQVVRTEIETVPNGRFRPVLFLSNDSNTYGYLANGRLRVLQRNAAGQEIFRRSYTPAEIQQSIGFGLVAAGQQRRLPIAVDLPSGEGTVEVEFTPEGGR